MVRAVRGAATAGDYIRTDFVMNRDPAMGSSTGESLIPELSQHPTSVFLHGSSRPLLNWVLYAALTRADPDFFWTDVRFRDEALDPLDPFARRIVPDRQTSVVTPDALPRSAAPSGALSTMIRSDEPVESIQRVEAFLQLPLHTQEVISRAPRAHRTPVLGLSNCHRLAALYPGDAYAPTLKAILDSGVSLAMTWADAVPVAALSFDFVIGVEGTSPSNWKGATIRCESGNSTGPLRAGAQFRLGDLPAIAEVLGPLGLSKR